MLRKSKKIFRLSIVIEPSSVCKIIKNTVWRECPLCPLCQEIQFRCWQNCLENFIWSITIHLKLIFQHDWSTFQIYWYMHVWIIAEVPRFLHLLWHEVVSFSCGWLGVLCCSSWSFQCKVGCTWYIKCTEWSMMGGRVSQTVGIASGNVTTAATTAGVEVFSL